MTRTLSLLAHTRQLQLEPLGPRQFRLARELQGVIVEYENRPISLERLYRLARTVEQSAGDQGIYVGGDVVPSPLTLEAVAWAVRQQPLKVVPLFQLYTELQSLFT